MGRHATPILPLLTELSALGEGKFISYYISKYCVTVCKLFTKYINKMMGNNKPWGTTGC